MSLDDAQLAPLDSVDNIQIKSAIVDKVFLTFF